MVYFEFQNTLEKNDQPPGEVSATFGQKDGRIYEHKLPTEMDNKYKIYGCDHTRNKERTHCRGRSLDQGEYLRFPCYRAVLVAIDGIDGSILPSTSPSQPISPNLEHPLSRKSDQ